MTHPVERLADFIPLREWAVQHGGATFPTFPTFSSLEWFMRNHRPRLVQSGQLIIRRGSAGSLVGPGFERVVLDILREESKANLGAAELAA